MDKYVQINNFRRGCWLKFYIHTFMCNKLETMPEEKYLLANNLFFEDNKKRSNPGPVPKHWLGFSNRQWSQT